MEDRSDIDEVRRRTSIISLVEKYVTLKRSGRGLVGLCPFHKEKTPSFHVNPELGLWKCFGQCSEGGDVFKFVQKIENLSFPEALERLALQSGVTLTHSSGPSQSQTPSERKPGDERERLYQINALAQQFYQRALANASAASDYLSQRGISQESIRDFSLGYAPDTWDGLTKYLTSRQASLSDAERAGLIGKGERGCFDRMRGRIVFPIFDVQDRLIAFGGRVLEQETPGSPKYWNSPETPVFSKSRTLFGLGRARKSIAESGQAIIVEGYTDVVAAHQAGFTNVVATLGTALTEEHVKILARLAPVVLLAFDADSAGLKAAYRAVAIFEAQEVEVRVLDLPAGEDPDSLCRTGRSRVFRRAIESAKPLTAYRIDRLIIDSDLTVPGGSIGLFKKALPILAAVPSMIEREQYVKQLAPHHPQYAAGSAYAEEHIRQDVAAYLQGRTGSGKPEESRHLPVQPLPAAPRGAAERAEQQFLRALTGNDLALAEVILTSLTPEEFPTERGRALAKHLYHAHSVDFEPNIQHVLSDLSESDPALAAALTDLLMEQEDAPLTQAVLEGDISYIKLMSKRRSVNDLRGAMEHGAEDIALLREVDQLYYELKGSQSARHGASRT